MEANMCITIEPGCYIVWSVVEETAAGDGPWAAYLNMENLKRFKHFGGVRIESDVIVHEDCCEDMCDVPRTIEEIEEWMKKDGKVYHKVKGKTVNAPSYRLILVDE